MQDDYLRSILDKITTEKSLADALGLDGFIKLKFFLANLFWRIPANDQLAESYLKKIDGKDLPFNFPGLTEDENLKLKRHILEKPELRRFAQFMGLPGLTFKLIDDPDFMKKWNFLYNNVAWNKHLTSDNPIVFRNTNELFSLGDNILFPLTGGKLLVCIKNLDATVRPKKEDAVQFDLATFSNASRYCCSSDKDHLSAIAGLYQIIEDELGEHAHGYIVKKTFEVFARLA